MNPDNSLYLTNTDTNIFTDHRIVTNADTDILVSVFTHYTTEHLSICVSVLPQLFLSFHVFPKVSTKTLLRPSWRQVIICTVEYKQLYMCALSVQRYCWPNTSFKPSFIGIGKHVHCLSCVADRVPGKN